MNTSSNYDTLLQQLANTRLEPQKPTNLIEIKNGKQSLSFVREEIQWVEAAGDYLFVHTEQGRSQMIRKTMKAMEDILGTEHFIRIHRSYIVNINQVKSYGNNQQREKVVTLKNQQQLYVSRRFKSKVNATLATNN
jgi:two-component system LytT family response regulator